MGAPGELTLEDAITAFEQDLGKDVAILCASSLHLLSKMLAGIAHGTRYADAPPFTPDAMGRELHLAVAHAPNGYWSAKQAAFVDPDRGTWSSRVSISRGMKLEPLARAWRIKPPREDRTCR